MPPLLPLYDPFRLSLIRRSAILSAQENGDFDRLARLTARLLRVPTARVTIVHPDGQTFVGSCGHRPEAERGTPLDESYCRHVVESAVPLVVGDARQHPLLRDSPAIRNGAIAYAGVPLVVRGETMGTVCAIGARPRKWTAADLDVLAAVSELAAATIELHLVREELPARSDATGAVDGLGEHAQKLDALGQLATGIAHDFNNVLSIITAHTGLALCDVSPETELHEHLTAVETAAHRAAGLTRQLLAFSRKSVPLVSTVDFNAVVREMCSMLAPLMGGIEISTSLAPRPANVSADATHLEQVLLNLAVNARDAMPSGGRLAVATRHRTLPAADGAEGEHGLAAGTYVELTVADTGSGIPPDVMDEIFTAFFTTKAPGQGTGLGLATVQRLVMQMGGRVAVESRVGEGTCFTVRLPAI